MLHNLILGLPTIIVCLVLQVILIVIAINYYSSHKYLMNVSSPVSCIFVLAGVVVLLIIGNLVQIFAWAVLFLVLGEFPQLSDAFYHSAVNFSSLGYGDIVMSDQHKLLGALESINGVLMIGISSAALIHPFKDSINALRQSKEDIG